MDDDPPESLREEFSDVERSVSELSEDALREGIEEATPERTTAYHWPQPEGT